MRRSGILMHISSLPSPYGIGTLGKEAYRFIDFLAQSGQSYWQILPIGPTSYGDSAYASFSTFAGNPYFIDLETLCEEGVLTQKDCDFYHWGDDPLNVDYGRMFGARYPILRTAWSRQKKTLDLSAFIEEQKDWLPDFALFMALKFHFNLVSWMEWPDPVKTRQPDALDDYREKLKDEIEFFCYTQYLFFQQWRKLKEYASEHHIKIIGDLPIYVACDSADAWSHPELFQFDETCTPKQVAGCPPDGFSATGQLWGNPLYDWKKHEETGYAWWLKRMKAAFSFYDTVRIDHFRGFESYYAIPYGDKTAQNGHWEKGPGLPFFQTIKKELGELDIIAEDLGFLTPEVHQLLHDTGFPGMKVLQFAFSPFEESVYLPHKIIPNSVIYTGTHDNDTTAGWLSHGNPDEIAFAISYLRLNHSEGYVWGFIKEAFKSASDLAIIPIQDYLGLGSEARMNEPSTLGKNWRFRVPKNYLSDKLSTKILELTHLYRRG